MSTTVHKILERVRWERPGKTSLLFEQLGIAHGFLGRGDQPPPVRHWARQVHGTKVVEDRSERTAPEATARVEADAVFTVKPGTVQTTLRRKNTNAPTSKNSRRRRSLRH